MISLATLPQLCGDPNLGSDPRSGTTVSRDQYFSKEETTRLAHNVGSLEKL